MRELLFFLLAVLPAVAAQAEPYGLYDPATGDILVGGLYGHLSATLHSTAGRLRPELLSEPPVFSPSNAQFAVGPSAGVAARLLDCLAHAMATPYARHSTCAS